MSVPPLIRLDTSLRSPAGRWVSPAGTPSLLLRCDARTRTTTLRSREALLRTWADPSEGLASLEEVCHSSLQRGDAAARWIGYLSYDLGRLFEEIPCVADEDTALPLFAFAFYPALAAGETPRRAPSSCAKSDGIVRSSFSRAAYLSAVERVIEYVRAGDVFQANLSQRFTAPLRQPPLEIYSRLKDRSPARYGAFVEFEDHALVCNSPELFLRVTPDPTGRRHVTTRPIKGTRPRLPGMEAELRASVKDQAELNMIVDLERNDLGRVCEIGTVKVAEPRTIEAHPTVFHGAATVEGTLRGDVTFVDLLRATFPGGSVTGAPKIRAMEIIEELEPVRRGPYCGAIGYVAADGAMEFNVAIRTMIVKGGVVHVPVGGGIVADSDPAAEYEETLVKARAMFDALGVSPQEVARSAGLAS